MALFDADEIASEELEMVEGTVESVIYNNESNGYSICELSIDDSDLITIVGTLPYVNEGERIKAMGRWDVHPTYGKQFRVETYEKKLPDTAESIKRYLSSRAIKGIGPKTAGKIVEKFGEDSFDVIEKHPEWLTDIPGITAKKADEISTEFKRQFGFRSVVMFCKDFFGPSTSVRVYKRWGGSSVDVIKENPYKLCGEIYGIGFERADRIAESLGVPKDSKFRIMAGIKYMLSYNAANSGHCYIPQKKLVSLTAEMLDIESEKVEEAYGSLLDSGEIVCIEKSGVGKVYLKKFYDDEKYTAKKLDLLDKIVNPIGLSDIDRLVKQVETLSGVEYAPLQKKAIYSAMKSGVMVLTGGPGTGKTTVIRAIISVFESLGMKTELAAPTGRAAKRMSEATLHEAKTIHRMLEMEYREDADEVKFARNENNLLDNDAIIIDEMSMVDINIMASLLRAIKPGTRLILIGDYNQLPSVGAGDVFRDIVESERFDTVILKDIFRQAGESMIVTNAHSVNMGELPSLDNTRSDDFFFITRENDGDISTTIVDLCKNRLPKKYGKDVYDKIQVISPSRKGEAGTDMLNGMIQKALNPPAENKKEKKFGKGIVFRVGDKVMQKKNNYDIFWVRDDGLEGQGVFNGDIGTIVDIDSDEEGKMIVRFDDREVEYDLMSIEELDLSYAITVHKSQGSEYPIVIIPMYNFAPQLMNRNLLYTAITRAQNMVVMVGRKEIVQRMVNNNIKKRRYTSLKTLLVETME